MEGDDPLVAQCRGRIGRLVSGKWRLDALIGVGGMAAVYMATHRNGNLAALKLLHDEVALNQDIRERFLREAYIANKVNHPGTVKVLDDDKDERGTPYIVMELLRGDTADARAQKAGGRLPISDALEILDQTLAVLQSAHLQNIVHRDLKPENLFMTDQGQVKVLDFGIARLREENTQRTQTGLVMGTPSFMAPEQAMGRWNEVDARTDLWAMGATTFTLLSGLPVHEAETAGEMLVAAATRPARSLARVLNGAPFSLVAMVDRALAYERDNRFPDAHSFRIELAKVRNALSGEPLDEAQLTPGNRIVPATVVSNDMPLPLRAPSVDDDDDARERLETFDPSSNSDEEIARMQHFFALLERALVSIKQYSPDHPEPKRRFDEAFRDLASALMTCDIALAWNLTPYSFFAREQAIWEPEAPLNRVPYQLFADGVRLMGFAPGLDQSEFERWVKLITLDPITDLAPEDDIVTLLWDADFEHVFFQAIDSFAEGTQEQRARYEADRANVVASAHADHRADVAQAVRAQRGTGSSQRRATSTNNAVDKSRELLRLLSRGDTTDTEAAARVANLNLMQESPEEAAAAQTLALDDNARALLAARMELDVSATSERFVIAAAEAFIASAKLGRSSAVTAPLRRAIDSLGTGAPHKAVEMILELRDCVQVEGKELETQSLRETMTSEVLSPATLLEILRSSGRVEPQAQPDYLKGVARVLGCLQPQHFDSALSALPQTPEGELRQLLLSFITRTGRGNELKIAKLFASADVELGLSLVRLLAEIDTPATKEAVALASQSPHALVRIEALGHVEGVSGPRLRIELRKLLEDPNAEVRLMALRAMEDHNIGVAGPFLVLRIQEAGFVKLPFEERRQALQTLGRLRAKRCEEVCMALLAETNVLLRTQAREETRELAAQFLGEVATSDPAVFLLEGIAKSSALRNSKRTRDAAAAALERLKQRAEEAARRRSGRKHAPGSKSETKTRTGGTTGAARGPKPRTAERSTQARTSTTAHPLQTDGVGTKSRTTSARGSAAAELEPAAKGGARGET